MTNYCCVEVTAKANENIVPIIFQTLTGKIPAPTKQRILFIGFEAEYGTAFRMNGLPNQVPSNGYFISPFDGERGVIIHSFSFDEDQENLKIWVIY